MPRLQSESKHSNDMGTRTEREIERGRERASEREKNEKTIIQTVRDVCI